MVPKRFPVDDEMTDMIRTVDLNDSIFALIENPSVVEEWKRIAGERVGI